MTQAGAEVCIASENSVELEYITPFKLPVANFTQPFSQRFTVS